jgi:hypothetical protein
MEEEPRPPIQKQSENSPLNRRTFIKAVAAVGAALFIPKTPFEQSMPNGTSKEVTSPDKVANFTGTKLQELQEILDQNPDENIKILISNDLEGDAQALANISIPPRDGIKPGTKIEKMVGLNILGENPEKKRRVTLSSQNPELPQTIHINCGYGIYCQNAELIVDSLNFDKGAASEQIQAGEEEAFIFADNSNVDINHISIYGFDDKVGEAAVMVGGKSTGKTASKGLTGIYLLNSEGKIANSSFGVSSWDSITSNGSNVRIEDCSIITTDPYVFAGAGVGATMGGFVEILRTKIIDRVKGVVAFGTNVSIKDSYIDCYNPDEDWYAVATTGDGELRIENSTLRSAGSVLEAPSPKTLVKNSVLIYDHDQDSQNMTRFEGSAIEISPSESTNFADNTIVFRQGINFKEVFYATLDPSTRMKLFPQYQKLVDQGVQESKAAEMVLRPIIDNKINSNGNKLMELPEPDFTEALKKFLPKESIIESPTQK